MPKDVSRSPVELRPPAEEEKGGLASMWQLLMQLRLVLPYLMRLVPLLDRGLLHPPDLTPLRESVGQLQTGTRDLGAQLEANTARLAQVEKQLASLREAADLNAAALRSLTVELRAAHRRLLILGVISTVFALTLLVLVALLFGRFHG